MVMIEKPDKKDIKRSAILREGTKLFERYGYRKVSVDEIVSAAGVAKGTFYLYFESKDLLYREIFESYHTNEVYQAFDMITREGDLKKSIYVDMVGGLYYLQKRPILMEIMLGNPAYLSESVTTQMVHAYYIEIASEVFKGIEHRLAPGLTMDDFIHLYTFYLGTLKHSEPADPDFWRLAANTARVLIEGMFSRTRWTPRPVEDIINEVDKLFEQDGAK